MKWIDERCITTSLGSFTIVATQVRDAFACRKQLHLCHTGYPPLLSLSTLAIITLSYPSIGPGRDDKDVSGLEGDPGCFR